MANKKDHLIELEEDLAPWLPREKEMGRILSAAATASMHLEDDIEGVEKSINIRETQTKTEVEKASQVFGLEAKTDENLEEFKRRALKEFNSITVDGSPSGILRTISILFDSGKENIEIENVSNKPIFKVTIDADSLSPEFGTINETLKLALDLTAANYALNFFKIGTLEYISKEELNNGSYDNNYGYSTVDGDGNVTSNGKYSGYYFKVN